MVQFGEHQHILEQRAFDVGAIVKMGAHRYGRILSRSEFLETGPSASARDNHLPVRTMEGETKWVHPSTLLVIEDPHKELQSLDAHVSRAKAFLKTQE